MVSALSLSTPSTLTSMKTGGPRAPPLRSLFSAGSPAPQTPRVGGDEGVKGGLGDVGAQQYAKLDAVEPSGELQLMAEQKSRLLAGVDGIGKGGVAEKVGAGEAQRLSVRERLRKGWREYVPRLGILLLLVLFSTCIWQAILWKNRQDASSTSGAAATATG